jgi:hypothetical protein
MTQTATRGNQLSKLRKGSEKSRPAEYVVVAREMRLAVARLPRHTAALFAADCAERVLPIFEAAYMADDRPRKAIEVARSGVSVTEARAAALAAHAAARTAQADGNADATYAARAAGHAAATIHVATHAAGAAAYAIRAAGDAGERPWQLRRLREVIARAGKT